MAFLLRLKGYAWAGLAFLLTVGAFLLRLKRVKQQRDNARYERDKARYQLDYKRDVEKADADIESDTDARTQKMAEQIEAGEPLDILANPNDY